MTKRTPPRSVFAAWRPAPERDPAAVLAAQEGTHVSALLPLRHERMGASPFAFYRGAAAVMAADLASLPVTGLRVQAAGDAHLQNFGIYGSPERNVVFDVNDFDETLPGPWEWDLLRLATSVELVARGSGFARSDRGAAVRATVAAYRDAMQRFAELPPLDVWYRHIVLDDFAGGMSLVRRVDARRAIEKARAHTTAHLLPKLTADQPPVFVDEPPIFVRVALEGEEGQTASAMFAAYRETLAPHVRRLYDRYVLRDLAFKVVGVGSVGTRCYVALLSTDRDEPLLLQLKEATDSVLAAYLGGSAFVHQGQRVVESQRLVQAASDIFLGWTNSEGRYYYVRQLRDMKATIPVARLRLPDLVRYARLCAWTLAHGHARSGSPGEIAAYVGASATLDDSAAAFAATYADLTERDFRDFCAAHPSTTASPTTEVLAATL